MTRRFDRILYQRDKTLSTKILLSPLYLLSLPYGWAVRFRAGLYALGLLKARRLPCPVISVGNVTVGGTGKTPLVMTLAKGLRDRKIPVAVLSRGYKRRRNSASLVSDGKTVSLSPRESGDEPFLIARTLKRIPVLVGKDRYANGQMAFQRFGVRGLLLDDGYQHLRLHRDLNILLIDSQNGFGDGSLLPRGILREPLSHLCRAQIFLLTKVESREACQSLEKRLHAIHPLAPVFYSHYEPLDLVGPEGRREELRSFQGKRVLALSGIANPDYFFHLLKKSGMEIVREAIYPDHHWYTENDLVDIEEKRKGTEWVVTTEKDMLKWENLKTAHLPMRALRIRMKIWEEEEFYKKVMELF
jgi:tetraacyldisaccharide 4'-kinase